MSQSADGRPGLYLIYLRGKPGLVLSKGPPRDWREVQDEYADYMTSLGPWSADDVVDFFAADLGGPSGWPFSARQVREFVASDETVLSPTLPDRSGS